MKRRQSRNQLKEKGWIKESGDGSDPRRKPVTLSAEGRSKLRQMHTEVNARVQQALKLLTSEERRTVLRGVELYARALADARKK